MQSVKKNGSKMIRGSFWLLVVAVGIAAVSYTPAIPEPAKVLLLGAVLVGVAFWGRRQLKEHG